MTIEDWIGPFHAGEVSGPLFPSDVLTSISVDAIGGPLPPADSLAAVWLTVHTIAYQGDSGDPVYTPIKTLQSLVVTYPRGDASHLNVHLTTTFLGYSQIEVNNGGAAPASSWNY
jgi:hypothetical protein